MAEQRSHLIPCLSRLRLLPLTVALICAQATPALAETIHLKNGTQVQGKILKEDATSFSIDTPNGRRKVAKQDVALVPAPDPMVAFIIGVPVAGAGHFYSGLTGRAGFFLGSSVLLGAGSWFAMTKIRPSSPSTAIVTGLVVYGLVSGLGAYDAYNEAVRLAASQRYHVDYDTP